VQIFRDAKRGPSLLRQAGRKRQYTSKTKDLVKTGSYKGNRDRKEKAKIAKGLG